MSYKIKKNLSAFLVTVLFSSCSTVTVQSDRLDSVENYIMQAEQILSSSNGQEGKRMAENNLGHAKAYLSTLRDNKKSLSKEELARYNTLTQHEEKVSNSLRQ